MEYKAIDDGLRELFGQAIRVNSEDAGTLPDAEKMLNEIANLITDKGAGRISLSKEHKEALVACCKDGFDEVGIDVLAYEVQSFAGNSFANIFRSGKGIPYSEIVRDVAKRLKVEIISTDTDEEVENRIITKIAADVYEKLDDNEKEVFWSSVTDSGVRMPGKGAVGVLAFQKLLMAGGFTTYKTTLIIANSLSKALMGRGLGLAANAGLMKGVAAIIPLLAILSAIWAAYDFSGPAYRVTVPSVIYIISLKKMMSFSTCESCGSELNTNDKFCSECGTEVRGEL